MTAEREAEIFRLGNSAEWPETMHTLRSALKDMLVEINHERAAHDSSEQQLREAESRFEQMWQQLDRERAERDSSEQTIREQCAKIAESHPCIGFSRDEVRNGIAAAIRSGK